MKLNRDEVVRLYQQGKHCQEIADLFGTSPQAAWYHLKASDVPLRVRRVNLNPDDVVEAYLAGASQRELAARYNCSTKPIKDILQERKVTRTPGTQTRLAPRKKPITKTRGRIISNGYVLIRKPNHGPGNAYTPEHRLVWEAAHGRKLLPIERVHHINGIRGDNPPENLVALTVGQHMQHHHAKDPNRLSEMGKRGAAARWHKT